MIQLNAPPNAKLDTITADIATADGKIDTVDTVVDSILSGSGSLLRTLRPLTEVGKICDGLTTGWTLVNAPAIQAASATKGNAKYLEMNGTTQEMYLGNFPNGLSLNSLWALRPYTKFTLEFYMRVESAITGMNGTFGLSESASFVTNISGQTKHMAGFEFSGGALQCAVNNNDTGTAESQALSAPTWTNINKFTMVFDAGAGNVQFKINGTLVHTFDTAANIPTELLFLGFGSSGGGGDKIQLFSIHFWFSL